MSKTKNTNGRPVGNLVAKVEEWTPTKAAKILANSNGRNRPLCANWVYELSKAIDNGEWEVNGETVKIAADGTLLDGQHRLSAVVSAEKPVRILTIRGVPNEGWDTIDQGRKRRGADVLGRHGEKNASIQFVAMSWVYRYDTDTLRQTGPGLRLRASQAVLFLEEHKEICESVSMASKCRLLMSKGLAACCHYLFSRIDPDAAEKFFEGLVDGENLAKGNPIYLLRQMLIDNRTSKRKLQPLDIFALTVKAWNHFRRREKIATLSWRPTGRTPEPFPKAE